MTSRNIERLQQIQLLCKRYSGHWGRGRPLSHSTFLIELAVCVLRMTEHEAKAFAKENSHYIEMGSGEG